MDIKAIQNKIAEFSKERDWDQFHTPKNLTMALAGEAAELLEIFQWLTDQQSISIKNSADKMAHVKEEIADVFIYLARLADKLDVDIEKAVHEKIALNDKKYPVGISKGKAEKYSS